MALGVVGFSDVRGRMKNALIAFSTVIEDGSHSPYGQFSASSQLPDYVDQAISFFCLPRWQCSRVETPYLKIQEAIKPEWTKMAPYRWCAVPDCVLRIELRIESQHLAVRVLSWNPGAKQQAYN